nr:unnamed protein product [Callosobruchus chinensis]
MKKVEASLRSGVATKVLYEPQLWYFHLLKFSADQKIPVDSIDTEDSGDTVI